MADLQIPSGHHSKSSSKRPPNPHVGSRCLSDGDYRSACSSNCARPAGRRASRGAAGPRTVGKSTLLAEIASRHGVEGIELDQPETRVAVAADPALFASGPSPVCIDEFQKAPEILDAIKAELNRRLEPGRFVITGSTRFDALPTAARALTGRIHIMEVLPFSQGEIAAHNERFLSVAMGEPASLLSAGASGTSRADYIDRLCAGGMAHGGYP